MSADNWIAVIKGVDGKFRGYDLCASVDYRNIEEMQKGQPLFEVATIEKAVVEAQQHSSEYGYQFVGLDDKRRGNVGRKKKI